MTLLRVSVGGLDFFGHRGPYAIGKDGFTGWDDQDYRSDSAARPNSHGNYPAPAYREPKTVNLNGHVVAGSPDQLNHLMDRFNGILANGDPGPITVERPWGSRWAPAATIVSRKAVEVGGLNRGTFALVLRLDDPQKLGEKRAFSGAVGTAFDVYQRGTAPAWSIITVTGSMPNGYEISLGAQLIQVTQAVVSGRPHTIDTRTGILRVNGAVVTGGLGIAELFRVDPGLPQSVYTLAPFSGTGTVRFDVTDTYT